MTIRKFFYNSGDAFLSEPAKDILSTSIVGSHKTYYIDGWTVMHFISGVIVSLILINKYKIRKPVELFVKLLIIHTLWETWQTYINMANPFKMSGHNSFVDSVIDTIAFLLDSLMVYLTIVE